MLPVALQTQMHSQKLNVIATCFQSENFRLTYTETLNEPFPLNWNFPGVAFHENKMLSITSELQIKFQ